MNPTSEDLKNIFYSGYPQGASWDVLDELDAKQIIIVSHEDKIESFADAVIRIEKKEHESTAIS